MGRDNFLSGFVDWQIAKGRRPRGKDIPSEPMSPIGARAKLRLVRRILIDLDFVRRKKIRGNGYEYRVFPSPGCRNIHVIKPEDIISWVDKKFPSCRDRKEKQRKAGYVLGAWKFGEYLTHELKDTHNKTVWRREDLAKLKAYTHPPAQDTFELEILPLAQANQFLEYVKGRNFTHYVMMYLSRWLGGMRYQEIREARVDLKSGSLRINMRTDKVTIYGKGKGGLQKPRYPTLIPEVKQILKEYLKVRGDMKSHSKTDDKYLFITRYGKKFGENSGHLNDSLRDHGIAYGQLSPEEIQLLTTHKIGRHGFGTYYYGKLPDKLLMQEMGLEDPKTLFRYANIVREARAELMKDIIRKDMKAAPLAPQAAEGGISEIKDLMKDLTKEQKMKLISELIT